MSGDYSRVRYTPHNGYIGILEQQGRIRLDADGNEQFESIDRRRRAEAIDTIGHGVVPNTTHDAFQITQVAGKLRIGPGRIYVDGILADCWGDESTQVFQADLGEMRGTKPVAYDKQPFYYANNFPSPAPQSTSIVYLDVWEREVTALEDPGLIDPALEGIDTTSRVQVAWQVKTLQSTTPVICKDPLPDSLVGPSTGVLSTGTTNAPATGSPCIIDPVGGYTGLENRLYRVQISKSGTVGGAGAAEFVYSRENASLGATLKAITTLSAGECQLSVSTVGRDRSFGFQLGDTLEVLDNSVEWSMRETGTGGTFVTVTEVDPDALTINVQPNISGAFTVVPERCPRIRRWDGPAQPTNNGTAITLEYSTPGGATETDGATVTFGSTDTQTLRAGDYWVFYARTATGSVEVLKQSPPRGVLHHYTKLAVIDPNEQITDCRSFWPPVAGGKGCCTFVVAVGDDIQKAIDALPPDIGGCICLKAGVHIISAPLVIKARHNVSIHGESTGTVVRNIAGWPALLIGEIKQATTDICVERIRFEVSPQSAKPGGSQVGILITHTSYCSLRDCTLTSTVPRSSLVAIALQTRCDHIEIVHNRILEVLAGVAMVSPSVETLLHDIEIRDNLFTGLSMRNTARAPVSFGVVGIDLMLSSISAGIVRIENNTISDFQHGIYIGQQNQSQGNTQALEISIQGNLITRNQILPDAQPLPLGWDGQRLGALVQAKLYGIYTDVNASRIIANTIQLSDPRHGGILVTASDVEVCDNTISSSVFSRDAATTASWTTFPVGVVVYSAPLSKADRCRVAANLLTGLQHGIAILAEQAESNDYARVTENRILNRVDSTAIDFVTSPPTLETLKILDSIFGILTINAQQALIAQNMVVGCTIGIAVTSLTKKKQQGIQLESNSVESCGIGVLLIFVSDSRIQNGRMQNNRMAIYLFLTSNISITGNHCTSSTEPMAQTHCAMLDSQMLRFTDNVIEGGETGIFTFICTDVLFNGNTIRGTSATGISAIWCYSISMKQNQVLNCGISGVSAIEAKIVPKDSGQNGQFGNGQFGVDISAGIAILFCSGLITVDSCDVMPDAPGNVPNCVDICVVDGTHVSIRGCKIVRSEQNQSGSKWVRALQVLQTPDPNDPTFKSVDVSGNYIDMNSTAADFANIGSMEIIAPQTPGIRDALRSPSDIVFVGNTVLQNWETEQFAVQLTADCLAITGNRMRSEQSRALRIDYASGLSYVGNIVRPEADITGATGLQQPDPTTSNVSA